MQIIEERLDQLEKRRGLLTVGSIAMMVAIAIQLSACGKDPAGPAGPSTNCDVSDKSALAGRNLSECDLSGLSLTGANLRSADLRSADLSGAILEFADLSGANLEGADLRSAWLSGANLEGADLSGANLEGAILRSADLSGANLEGAMNVPELSASQEEEACWSDCG